MEQNLKKKETLPDRDDLSFPVSLSDVVKTEDSDHNHLAVSTFLPEPNKTYAACKKDSDTEKFRQSLKYQDKESYVSQRDHKIGIGLFNTDEIEDLPPRHRKKVVSVYEKLRAYEEYLLDEKSKANDPNILPPPDLSNDHDNVCLVTKSTENKRNSPISNKLKLKETLKHSRKNKYTESKSDKFSDNHVNNASKPKCTSNKFENMSQKNSQTRVKTQIFESHEMSTKNYNTDNSLVSVDNSVQSVHPKHKCLVKDSVTGSDIRQCSETQKEYKKDVEQTVKLPIPKSPRKQNNHNFHANHAYNPSNQHITQNKNFNLKDHENTHSKLKVSRNVNYLGDSKSNLKQNDLNKTLKSESEHSVDETNLTLVNYQKTKNEKIKKDKSNLSNEADSNVNFPHYEKNNQMCSETFYSSANSQDDKTNNQKTKKYPPKESGYHKEAYHKFDYDNTSLSRTNKNSANTEKRKKNRYDSDHFSDSCSITSNNLSVRNFSEDLKNDNTSLSRANKNSANTEKRNRSRYDSDHFSDSCSITSNNNLSIRNFSKDFKNDNTSLSRTNKNSTNTEKRNGRSYDSDHFSDICSITSNDLSVQNFSKGFKNTHHKSCETAEISEGGNSEGIFDPSERKPYFSSTFRNKNNQTCNSKIDTSDESRIEKYKEGPQLGSKKYYGGKNVTSPNRNNSLDSSSDNVHRKQSFNRTKNLNTESDSVFDCNAPPRKPHNKQRQYKGNRSYIQESLNETAANLDLSNVINKEFSSYLSNTSVSTLIDKNFNCMYDNKEQFSMSHTPQKERDIHSQFASCSQSGRENDRIYSREEKRIDASKMPQVKDIGFFVHITVSEDPKELDSWELFFKKHLGFMNFDVFRCCDFAESLILQFETNEDALKAHWLLYKLKRRNRNISDRHIKSLSSVKKHLVRPCLCENVLIEHCDKYFDEFAYKYISTHKTKMDIIIDKLNSLTLKKSGNTSNEEYLSLKDAFDTFKAMETVFNNYVRKAKDLARQCSVSETGSAELKKLKLNFSRECNSFERGLPIYSQKDVILNAIKNYPVSVIVAETGSGKSTQLTQYLLQTSFADNGSIIICTQPRKIAAVSITKFVCTQVGSSVGNEVGYDVGIEKKFGDSTKIIYMTDYALLRKCLRNRNLKKVSCVIIDEAHERTLYTDLLLGLLKQCLGFRQDLRIIITSATINPSVFVKYFNLPDGAVINVPGRAYPVEVIWSKHNVNEENMYVKECVRTAVRVHQRESKGDVLVFLSSPAEIDEAILLFEEMCPENSMPELMSLHGKSDIKDQMLVFETSTNDKRRIIFATNAAETSLTIPGIKYVIDSGMAKEMIFYPEKNKSCLMPTLINKSSAEQRKGRAGRTQPGVCYRLYSKKDFENMPERALPELLKTDLLNALLKVYEFGIKPSSFDFVESPSREAITKSIDSLEVLELIENNDLTKLGKQVVQLSIEPRLAKFILLGVESGMGHEAAIIAALVSEAGRIFLRFDDNKEKSDQKKKSFCQKSGDLCTFLEIYKRWLEVSQTDRFNWCVSNYVSFKALSSARKTVKEILFTLRQDLGIKVSSRYNNLSFKNNFEIILFSSFIENLCIYSGHPSLGYQSPNFKESLFIHPSSSLKYLRIVPPKFLVYTVFMETSRNYILDVTPLKEETVNKAFSKGNYALAVEDLKRLQIPPITLGPFGEKILYRHILGKGGSVINNIEYLLEKLTKNRNFRIDICRDKGLVIIHVEEKFHERVSNFIQDIVNDAREEMAKEADVIKMDDGFYYYCLSTGGLIHDIVMPGEFREITIEPINQRSISELESILRQFGPVQNLEKKSLKYKHSINVTYLTVSDAQNALKCLNKKNVAGVKVQNIVPKLNKSSKPLYKLKFTWPRLLAKGTGSILFSSAEDRVMVSGKLSTKSLYVDNNRISVTPSQNDLCLNLKNIPQSANERLLQEKISEALPDFLRELVKCVEINRQDSLAVSKNDIIKIKDQLSQSLSRFTPPSKVAIDVVYPTSTSKNYEAFAYFECDEDGSTAFQQLRGKLKLNNIQVDILEILESQVECKEHVYHFLRRDIQTVITKHEGKVKVTKLSNSLEDKVAIQFSCRSHEKLKTVNKEILSLVRDRKVECRHNKKYFYLFTDSGEKILNAIQARTKTLIERDTDNKVVFIYGQSKMSYTAEAEIHSFFETAKLLKTKIYDLKSSHIPPGFLKELYSRYGFDLYGLITKFDLKTANIDMKFGNLTVEGEVRNIRKVDEHLENICAKLYTTKPKKTDDDVGFGMCAICLDPVKFDYYRLENCGHSFCKSCLLLQLESKIIPVTCAQENCGQPFFLIDINRILSLGGEKLRREFQNAALQHHVSTHAGQISYCHSPDCPTVYRVSKKSDIVYNCPACLNDICAYCQTFSHKGMNCDIYQNSKEDEDYSLKVWLKDNKSCKQCPNCKMVIEKIDGCNHMECLNCKSHLCWLCLEIFKSGDLVYDHLPFCPKNQTS
ncbi:uncharacterized protein [Parasteatoda tepidariorum]|nr:ATP-dependent RNA helicase DEAH12, chloroplastic isoform X2 [Parasteatoda tepidariorum]XP_042900686.1 ATP-dependent RNA helicase DEAH12, chloroplastic isoform X2 [Parasteatoda tepidariorum]